MTREHVIYPASGAGLLHSPIRRIIHSPLRIVGRYIRPGDTVLDLGCGPGYFSLPMARMVGEQGKVIAVDVQEEMLALVRQAAEKEGLTPRFRFHLSRGGLPWSGDTSRHLFCPCVPCPS